MVDRHEHNGVDAPRLNPKDFKGFPVFDSVPTHNAPNGSIVVYESGATKRLYIYINGNWRYTALT